MAEYIDKGSVINRLIDLENEFQQYKPFHGFEHAMYRKICETEIAIGKMPSADVEPVRHGRWEWDTEDIYRCNNCAERSHVKEVMGHPDWDYCPNCGAKMDRSSNEEWMG